MHENAHAGEGVIHVNYKPQVWMTLVAKIRNPDCCATALDAGREFRASEVDCLGVLGRGQPRDVLLVLRDDKMAFGVVHGKCYF